MLLLSLLWLLLGSIVGVLALTARLRPDAWGCRGLLLLGFDALAALLGGWMGTLLFGRLFGTPTALWVAILLVLLAWLVVRLRTHAPPKA